MKESGNSLRSAPIPPEAIQERVAQAQAASTQCLKRLEQVLIQCDPADAPLQELLSALVFEEAQSESRLSAVNRATTSLRVRPTQYQGEARLDRDAAIYLAEEAEKERASAFLNLTQGVPDGDPRTLLQLEEGRERPRLILLRNILLLKEGGIRSLDSLHEPVRTWFIEELARLILLVRDGRSHLTDLRALFDRGVASGPETDDRFTEFLDGLTDSASGAEQPLSAGLDRLARAHTPAEAHDQARELLTAILDTPS